MATLRELLQRSAIATRPDPQHDTVRFACVVAYDGLCFHGWMAQKSSKVLTVQGCLEHRLSGLLRRDACVIAHGRTDAGVHSAGTVFHVDMTQAEARRLAGLVQRRGNGDGGGADSEEVDFVAAAQCLLNVFGNGTTPLPDTLCVLSCDAVCATRFHARRSSCGKAYLYRVAEARPLPLVARGLHVLGHVLDLGAMQAAAAALLEGEGHGGDDKAGCVRDWSFLARKRELSGEWEPDRSPVRRLFALEVTRDEEAAVVTIRIAGDFFLWNMCRRIAGLLVSVGQGRCSAEDVERDVAACPIITMPAKGLELQEVWYADDGAGLDPHAPAASC